MARTRAPSAWHAVLPAGAWLLAYRCAARTARTSLRLGLPRAATRTLIRRAGALSRIGFATWRSRGGKWR